MRRRARRALAQFRRARRLGRARHDRAALHRHAVRAGGARTGCATPNARVSSHYVVFENGSIVQLVPETQARLARRRLGPGAATPTSIPARSASRSAIPATTSAIRIFRSRQIAAVITLCRGIIDAATSSGRNDSGAFRRRAEPQARSGREISLAAAAPFRRRALGRAGAARQQGPVSTSATAATKVAELQKVLGEYGYGIRRTGRLRSGHPRRRSPPSSAISARRGSTASPTPRPADHAAEAADRPRDRSRSPCRRCAGWPH